MDELEKILEVKSLKDVELQKENKTSSLLDISSYNHSDYNHGFERYNAAIKKAVKLDSAKC